MYVYMYTYKHTNTYIFFKHYVPDCFNVKFYLTEFTFSDYVVYSIKEDDLTLFSSIK